MNKSNLFIGFAIFTMFFGAGNMVLPLLLVQKWQSFWPTAFFGFCISAVLFTLLGLIASVFVRGDIKDFFAPLGTFFAIVVQVILMSIEGPFGIVPRSMIVAYGSASTAMPFLSKSIFFSLSCIMLYFVSINKNTIIRVLGKYLTPIMLLFLAIQVLFAIYFEDIMIDMPQLSFESFIDGIVTGYLTYDLPGAIYFSAIAMGYLKATGDSLRTRILHGIKASIVSIILMILVYGAFILLGLLYHNLIIDVVPEKILPSIVKGSMGFASEYLFSIFIILACLTTAVAAISIWSEFIVYLFSLYKIEVKFKLVLFISVVVTYFVAMRDFMALMKMLLPVLKILYPVLIGLCIYNIYKHRKVIIENKR